MANGDSMGPTSETHRLTVLYGEEYCQYTRYIDVDDKPGRANVIRSVNGVSSPPEPS